MQYMEHNFFIRLKIVSLIFTFLAFVFSGCSHEASVAEKARQKNILIIGNGGDFSRLDPQIAYHAYDRRIQMALFEPLVVPGPNQEILPALAESWEIEPDYKTYRFYLRQNARWSDGSPLTAHDCVFSFRRILSPTLGTPLGWFSYNIEGAKALAQGQTQDVDSLGVKVIDDHTLEIKLATPSANFLQILTYMAFVPLPEDHIKKHGAWNERTNDWDKPEHIVSNGPFQLKSQHPGQSCTLERNPYYWDAENVQLNGIIFQTISDTRTEEQAFRTDQLHVTYGLAPHRLEYYAKNADPDERAFLQIHSDFAAPELIVLNTKDPALQDQRVRRALTLAIDRKRIAELFFDGRDAAKGFVPPGIKGYTTPDHLLDLDIPKARELLAAAGFPNGIGFPKLVYSYSSTLPYKPIAEAIQEMLKENLGIDLEILQVDAKTNFSKMTQGNFQLGRIVWRVECGDVGSLLAFFQSDNTANMTGWRSDRFDELLANGSSSINPQEAEAYFQKAETLLMEESPVLPLIYQPLIYLKKPYILNWTISGSAYIPYKSISIQNS